MNYRAHRSSLGRSHGRVSAINHQRHVGLLLLEHSKSEGDASFRSWVSSKAGVGADARTDARFRAKVEVGRSSAAVLGQRLVVAVRILEAFLKKVEEVAGTLAGSAESANDPPAPHPLDDGRGCAAGLEPEAEGRPTQLTPAAPHPNDRQTYLGLMALAAGEARAYTPRFPGSLPRRCPSGHTSTPCGVAIRS